MISEDDQQIKHQIDEFVFDVLANGVMYVL